MMKKQQEHQLLGHRGEQQVKVIESLPQSLCSSVPVAVTAQRMTMELSDA